MQAVRRQVVAGLAAALVSGAPSAVGWLLGRGPDPVAATREIGRRASGRPSLVVGGVVHLGLSVAFALPAAGLRARRPALAGAAYGLCLYVLDFRVVAPRAWPEVLAFDGPLQAADHVLYGVVLALAGGVRER